jgi:hypothetical protein
MADGITVTPGAGATVDTDEVSRGGATVHQQVLKISLGADNACDLLLDSGQQTKANSLPVVLPSDQIVEAGSRSTIVTVVPTLAVAGAYIAGDIVGVPFEVALAFAADKLSGYLMSISGYDKAMQAAALTLWFFKTLPTFANADNGVFSITDANLATAVPIGKVDINPGDYSSSDSNSVIGVDFGKLLKSTTTSFFAAIRINQAATYANGDLSLSFHMAQD